MRLKVKSWLAPSPVSLFSLIWQFSNSMCSIAQSSLLCSIFKPHSCPHSWSYGYSLYKVVT